MSLNASHHRDLATSAPLPVNLHELRKQPHTSHSALKTFLLCPRKYRLQYIERARPDFYAAALALGSVWHESVAEWLTGSDSDDALDERLRQRLRERLSRSDIPVLFDDEDENEERFVAKALEMIGVFRQSVTRPRRVLGSELAFSLSLRHAGEVLNRPLVGALDAIVEEEDGQLALWELKTAKKKWSADQAEFDVQTTLYQKAARELGYSNLALRILVTTKSKLPSLQVLDIQRHHVDELELEQLFFGVERAIEAGIDYPLRGWQCRSCAFASRCRP